MNEKYYLTYFSKKSKKGLFKQNPKNNKFALIMNPKIKKQTQIKYNPETYTKVLTKYQLHEYYSFRAYFRNYRNNVYSNYLFQDFIERAKTFFKNTNFLQAKHQFYTLYKIPKKKGGYRETYGPSEELLELQKQALYILDNVLKVKEHNVAHAYVKKRDGVSNALIHQYSKHFIKLDFKNFFPSITKNLLESSLYSLTEFAIISIADPYFYKGFEGTQYLQFREKIKEFTDILVELATLDDTLPQGSPLSPKLSNLVMIPYDHEILEICKNKKYSKTKIMYTRYADDITLSSFHPIDKREIIKEIKLILPKEIQLNTEKTKYLKNTNRLFITGAKINKDNNITYGHEKTAILKRKIFQMLISQDKNKDTKLNQEILGQLSYAMRIEPIKFKLILQNYCQKFNLDPKTIYKQLIN